MSLAKLNHRLAIGLFALGAVVVAPNSSQAGYDSPIYQAAEYYREAVRKFEKVVLRCDFVRRCDERLVDDLEDSTSTLRSAARDTARLDRLYRAFYETRLLHFQVERVFFVHSTYPRHPQLEYYWDIVARAYQNLELQMQRCGSPNGISYRPRVSVQIPAPITCPTPRYIPPAPRSVYVPQPALSPYSPRPALEPRSARPSTLPPTPTISTPRIGGDERFNRTPYPTRQPVASRNGLRVTLTGAMLQRLSQ